MRVAAKRESAVYLIQIFKASPLAGLTLCLCLATIFWCIILTHREKGKLDRLLSGLLGMIAIYEGLRVLKDSGWAFSWGSDRLESWADFLIASMYLIAALMLKLNSMDRARTLVRLRLVEANEKSLSIGKTTAALAPDLSYLLFDASPLATFATDTDGTVIYWNPAAEELFGWTRDEVWGQPLPFNALDEFVTKRGSVVDAATWISPIFSGDGSRRATLVIAASPTALRAAGLGQAGPGSNVQLLLNV